jgi:Domain of unknown function (DUF222)
MFPTPEEALERRERIAEWDKKGARHRAEINAAEAREAELVAEMIEYEYWTAYADIASPIAFLSWKWGMTPSRARKAVKTAGVMKRWPKVFAAFKAGELNVEQVAILDDICEKESEEQLVEVAKGLSGSQLSRFAGYYRSALTLEREDQSLKRYVSSGHREDGTWRMSARLPSEQGALVDKALQAAFNGMRAEGYERDEEANDPYGAGRADALVMMAESLIANGPKELAGTDAYQVVINVDVGASDSESGETIGKIARCGGIVSEETLARLRCDASFVEMISKGKEQLYVGRKRRQPSTPLRRALNRRDQCCLFPGCNRTGRLQAHHIEWWERDQGSTDIDKMVLLCSLHHRSLHQGRFTIEMINGNLEFRDASGHLIERDRLEASGDEITDFNFEYGIEVDDDACLPDWGGEPGDLREAVGVYMDHRDFLKAKANSPP